MSHVASHGMQSGEVPAILNLITDKAVVMGGGSIYLSSLRQSSNEGKSGNQGKQDGHPTIQIKLPLMWLNNVL